MIKAFDQEELRRSVRSATPFPYFCLDNFLDSDFAESVARAFPSYDEARNTGRAFSTVNERKKVQVTDSRNFAAPIADLHCMLAAPSFLAFLSYVFDIPNLLADDQLIGGGIHEMAPGGRLDVHVDFNYIRDRQLHRRLNIVIYFNNDWKPEWGGNLELWDRDVQRCCRSLQPAFNRCVVFSTTDIGYHGVTAVHCPHGRARNSFAAYYYTKEASPHWTGQAHSSVFRGRPNEIIKSNILMPLEQVGRQIKKTMRRAKAGVQKLTAG